MFSKGPHCVIYISLLQSSLSLPSTHAQRLTYTFLDYSVLLYQGLGFSNMISLMLAALYVTVACAGNYICSLLIDRVGRVKLLRKFYSPNIFCRTFSNSPVTGLIGCMLSLAVETALDAVYTGDALITNRNEAGLRAGVFFMFLYITFYGCCIDANTFVYCSEIFPSHFRSYGTAWSLSILFLSAMVYPPVPKDSYVSTV